MVERCDGVMLTGGDDLHPDLYDPHAKENKSHGRRHMPIGISQNFSDRTGRNSTNRFSPFAVARRYSMSHWAAA